MGGLGGPMHAALRVPLALLGAGLAAGDAGALVHVDTLDLPIGAGAIEVAGGHAYALGNAPRAGGSFPSPIPPPPPELCVAALADPSARARLPLPGFRLPARLEGEGSLAVAAGQRGTHVGVSP